MDTSKHQRILLLYREKSGLWKFWLTQRHTSEENAKKSPEQVNHKDFVKKIEFKRKKDVLQALWISETI